MALDGQVTYLSTESAAEFQRPRTPRRSPRLRMCEEEEEQIESEGVRSNSGMRAPIIGYEVVDHRQKFTVQWLNLLVHLKLVLGCSMCSCVVLLCFKKVIEGKTCDLTKAIRKKFWRIYNVSEYVVLQCHCVYFLSAWLNDLSLSLIYALDSTKAGSIVG